MPQARLLIDTNILLAASNSKHPSHAFCQQALGRLLSDHRELCYTLQVASEFWNVSTRPIDRNGHGLSPDQAARQLSDIEQGMVLLPDTVEMYQTWRLLVSKYAVSGVQVHDAKLVAAMFTHSVPEILTLNRIDFARYSGLVALHPSEL